MPRELASYRDCIENLNALYPNREVFILKEACQILGRSQKTVKKRYLPDSHEISKVNLARILARMGAQP